MVLIMGLALILPMALIIVNTMLNKKDTITRDKMSPFECGFDPKSSARTPFSIRFYLIAVIFLIFDIEITLIMPIPLIFTLNDPMVWNLLSMFFIFILLAGLFHEWNQGALNWSK